jgi:hypothetical protein
MLKMILLHTFLAALVIGAFTIGIMFVALVFAVHGLKRLISLLPFDWSSRRFDLFNRAAMP